MALVFIAIDPDTTGDHCPAVFVEEETGDLLFQGWTVTDPEILAEVAQHNPVADNESVVRLPARMRAMILEALHGIQFEYEVTAAVSIAAGEEVRWLPRRQGMDLCLPLNDYWVFDGRLVRFHFFSGTGEIVEDELAEDPSVVKLCAQAFEAVWERAIPHDQYQPI